MKAPEESPFPHYTVSEPDAYRRGEALGRLARQQILEAIDAYAETFAHYTALAWADIRSIAIKFRDAIGDYDQEILAEIEGTASGAGLEIADLLALNARSEIMFGLSVPTPPECTTFYVGPTRTADHHVLLGQNWDWRPRAVDTTCVVHLEQGAKPAVTFVPEAGLVGKGGHNSAGIGVTLNALVSDRDVGEFHVPIHVILRGILNSTSLDAAVTAVTRADRAASANFLIGSAEGRGVSAETTPGGLDGVHIIDAVDDIIVHTNHFVRAGDIDDRGLAMWPDSVSRLARAETLLAAGDSAINLDVLKQITTDREGAPGSICRLPDSHLPAVEQSSTVATILMDLTDHKMLLSRGLPTTESFSLVDS